MADNPVINAAIQQLNLGYDGLQDRLLLRLGLTDSSEVKVWLTRRMVKAVWGLLQSADLLPMTAPDVFNAQTSEALDQAAKKAATQNAMQHMDFSETYEANRKAVTDEPLLPKECRILALENGSHVLELESADGQMLRIPMNQELIQALTNMLQLTTKDAGWDIAFAGSVTVISESANRPVLH